MKHFSYISTLLLAVSLSSCGALLNIANKEVKLKDSDSVPVSHDLWTDLLQKHVRNQKLDYQGIIHDSVTFHKYLGLLESSLPNEKNWSDDERFAYWVNAYNAFTVKMILDNYPVKSIKDIKGGVAFINSVWDINFIEIEGQSLNLNDIEHGILRKKWKDPRIHFAVNCASISCPALRDQAYVAEKLEDQLNDATSNFLNDSSKNKLAPNNPVLSPIFSWYKPDFTKDQSVIEFVNQFIDEPISPSANVGKMDYDWNLNDIKD